MRVAKGDKRVVSARSRSLCSFRSEGLRSVKSYGAIGNQIIHELVVIEAGGPEAGFTVFHIGFEDVPLAGGTTDIQAHMSTSVSCR